MIGCLEYSRLVLEWKDMYREKILSYIEDISIFNEETGDPSEINKARVVEWAKKWNFKENIGDEELEWITSSGVRPGKAYANIKTHKADWPHRYIISSIGTAIENLARWVEFHLKVLARQHPTYIQHTGRFLQYIEDLNEMRGPFEPNSVLLVSRDIKDFYPSCNTEKCLDV